MKNLLSISILSLMWLVSPTSFGAGMPQSGIYAGKITLGSSQVVDLSFSISYTKEEIPGESDELFQFKKRMTGSFILEKEGGPYSFSYVNYSPETGVLDMRYSRVSASSLLVGSTSNNSQTPSLRLLGKLTASGTISGTVTSGFRGEIGTFSAGFDKSMSRLVPKDIMSGHWVGVWKFPEGNSRPMDLFISASGASQSNPSDMELDFTPGRTASAQLGKSSDDKTPTKGADVTNLPFTFVTIDYLRSTIRMSNTTSATATTLTLIGDIKGDVIQGTAHSTLKGITGTFEVRRQR